jgi:hypothetical protein
MAEDGPRVPRARRGGWDPELGERFLELLRETGNARASARRLGKPNSFRNRRRRDPEFRAKWDRIVAETDGRLKRAPSSFLEPRPAGARPALETSAEKLGGMLRPGRKRPRTRAEPVIRRTSNGRLQVTLAREGHWTS